MQNNPSHRSTREDEDIVSEAAPDLIVTLSRLVVLFVGLKSMQSDPNDPNDNGTYDAANVAYDRTLAWTDQLDSLPTEHLAASFWPPSICEAAQNDYAMSLPFRQPRHAPLDNRLVPVEEVWRPSHTALYSYQERSQNLDPFRLEDVYQSNGGGSLTTSYPDFGLGLAANKVTPPASDHAQDIDCPVSDTVK
jgi:hypothetical protein